MQRAPDESLAATAAAAPAPYVAPAWLPGRHLQTVYPALLPQPAPAYRRERWDTPDGDFVELDWIDGRAGTPLVVLFHGLEGSSGSHYARALMRAVNAQKWHGAVYHYRGCGGAPNRLPRAYHSGDTAEVDWALPRLKARFPAVPVYAVGVSLGGNVLLKWLGEEGGAASGLVARAAAVSAPLDLMASGQALEHGFNRFYARVFLSSLRPKVIELLDRHPGLCDRERVLGASTMREFDNVFTAPVHGFRDTDDYWTRASSKPWLARIAVPTLVLNARNDPFLPERALPGASEVSEHVTLEYPTQGGHVGFCTGPFPGRIDWLPRRLLGFFGEQRSPEPLLRTDR
jgi:predicted alpha/beta-fold hydrolase